MDNEERPPIPAELRRRVLIEVGHRCAIPTCRYIDVDVHHIEPWEQCRKHEYENLIALCPNCHRRATRGDIDRKSLRKYKANLRFAIEKYSQFEIDVLFELSKLAPDQELPFPKYLVLLIKRLLDSGFVKLRIVEPSEAILGAIGTGNPDFIRITERGKVFINSLNVDEIGY